MRDTVFRKDIADEFVKDIGPERILILYVEGDAPIEVTGSEQPEAEVY